MDPITISHVDINSLHPADYNPRAISTDEMEKLRRSIQEFGFVDPVIANTDGMIVGGHQRWQAAKTLGLVTVPCVRLTLADSKAKALNLALNKIHGEWDNDKLTALLADLNVDDSIDELLSGFDQTEIDDLLEPVEAFDNIIEAEPELEQTPARSKHGDLWQLGTHRLLCGSAFNDQDLNSLMDGAPANMVCTDPPYNVAYSGTAKPAQNQHASIANDQQNPADWSQFCRQLAQRLKQLCPAGDIYCWHAPGPDGMRLTLDFIDEGCHWSGTLIWKKQHFVLSRSNYHGIYEACFYGWFAKSSYRGDRTQDNVWEFDRPIRSALHPTMKPLGLCAKAIQNSSQRGDIVVDLFAGSGSVLMACELSKRSCYAMEIDPNYVDSIIARWEQATQQQAVCLQGA